MAKTGTRERLEIAGFDASEKNSFKISKYGEIEISINPIFFFEEMLAYTEDAKKLNMLVGISGKRRRFGKYRRGMQTEYLNFVDLIRKIPKIKKDISLGEEIVSISSVSEEGGVYLIDNFLISIFEINKSSGKEKSFALLSKIGPTYGRIEGVPTIFELNEEKNSIYNIFKFSILCKNEHIFSNQENVDSKVTYDDYPSDDLTKQYAGDNIDDFMYVELSSHRNKNGFFEIKNVLFKGKRYDEEDAIEARLFDLNEIMSIQGDGEVPMGVMKIKEDKIICPFCTSQMFVWYPQAF